MDRASRNYVPFPTAGWPGHPQAAIEEVEEDDGWGVDAAAASGTVWDPPADDWGGAPVAPGDWGEPAADDGWGQSPAVPANGGQEGDARASRGRSRSRQGGAQSNPQPTTQQGARAHASPNSIHPSAHAHQMSPSGWGPAVDAWGTEPPRPSWAQPAAPKPPGQKPAWTKWASEAKLSPPQPSSYQRQQPAAHPGQSQAYLHAQLLAEQQSIMHSIQEANTHSNGHAHGSHSQQTRPPPQYADSWANWGRDAWGGERASTIPEEDEYEDDGWGDTEDEDGWGQSHGYDNNQRVRFSSNVSYAGTPSNASRTPSHGPAPASGASPPRRHASSNPQMWAAPPNASRTMKMATGTFSPTPVTVKTTVFELPPPRNGFGENAFVSSHGEALIPAERALYNQGRPTKERIRWGFNPDKDPRVGSLLHWIAAMSNGLAEIGLQRFLDTRERGALLANAEFHLPAFHGAPPQPAFDWVTLSELQNTLDSTLQSSVTLYDPAFQVIVFVFLLSPSGNSMAVWRRKLNVPDALRDTNQDEILAVKAGLKTNYPVYVDEARLPVMTPNPVKKKKVRFAFIRRIFGGGKKAAAA
ncbi:hypothetical protein LXA43DRAFT_54467 [Ganoderma leucocontextum]|nr:hypothetical protein LXA43DRAFT_54467 [Ganoderma leucocontextum]